VAKLSRLRQWFDEFNQTYFGGELEPITIRITRARKYYGKFIYRESAAGDREPHAIYIARRESDDDTRDALLHEMVHYYLCSKELDREEEHGPNFQREYERICGTKYLEP
jgi:hypothetical protein